MSPKGAKSVDSPNGSSAEEDDLLIPGGIALDRMGFSEDFCDLINQAIADTTVLTVGQLVEISETLCYKAFEKTIYSYPISLILVNICFKDKTTIFPRNVVTVCNYLFQKEYSTLRASQEPNQSPKKVHWPAFCAFLTDFYLNLTSKSKAKQLTIELISDEIFGNISFKSLNLELADLLYKVCYDILGVLKVTNVPNTETECLVNIIRSVGKQMEIDRPYMRDLISITRETFLGPVSNRLPENCIKSLLELIELAASGWTFNEAQIAYYYPSSSKLPSK